jgi:hexokinase
MSRENDNNDNRITNWFRHCWDSFCLRPKESLSEHSHPRPIDSHHKSTRFVSQAGKEVVTRDSNFDGLLHDPVEENITSILQANENVISSEDYTELMRITSPFHITVETLAHVMTEMETHCQMGLEPNTNKSSDLKMLPTYVTNLPTKKEQGEILALDLGGTNFRTLLVKLHPNTEPQVISEAHIVPDSKKILASDLFEFIVDVLKQFMIRNRLDLNQEYVLGFTFSFACEQIALNKGNFLTPSKGWVLSDLVGQDVVEKLQTIIYQKQLKVKITALINDTVGTLMACGKFHKAF